MDLNININFNSKKLKTSGILVIILIVAAFLRIYHIGFQGTWLDEIHTIKEADPGLTFTQFNDIIMLREGIPHFYFLTIRFLAEIFGISIELARMVSAIAGILSVYYIYKLTKRLYSKNAGYIAAALLTFNVVHIEYSQEARSYSLLILFTIIAFYRAVILTSNTTIKNAVYLGVFAGLITNAHPIGVIYVVGIYLFILIILLLTKDKNSKIQLFIKSFISGVITLLVFWPVYCIIEKVSALESFWVPAPTIESIKQIFIALAGRSDILLYIAVIAFVFLLGCVVIILMRNRQSLPANKTFVSFLLLFIWFFVAVGILLIKSYSGPSLVLLRYFTGIIVPMMLFIAIGIEHIKNKYLKASIALASIALIASKIFIPQNYYTTVTKAEFSKICDEVMVGDFENLKIISNWGWLLSFYLDRYNENRNVYELNLENYVAQVKAGAMEQESFWYIDGNSRPYSVNAEIQEYLDKNYTVAKTLNYYDSWAKLYITNKLKTQEEISINLIKFKGAPIAGGKLMFFENSKISYPAFYLNKGKYKITITGNSLPSLPINNENAKLNIYLNSKLQKQFVMSEEPNSTFTFDYFHETDSKVNMELEFVNDFLKDGKDRNVEISRIEIEKMK